MYYRRKETIFYIQKTSFVPKVIFIVKILSKVSINKRIEENGTAAAVVTRGIYGKRRDERRKRRRRCYVTVDQMRFTALPIFS